jgi:hypothetical protein
MSFTQDSDWHYVMHTDLHKIIYNIIILGWNVSCMPDITQNNIISDCKYYVMYTRFYTKIYIICQILHKIIYNISDFTLKYIYFISGWHMSCIPDFTQSWYTWWKDCCYDVWWYCR